MTMKNITYKKAGVDIAGAGVFKSKIKTLVRKSFRPEVLKDIGGFGSFFELPFRKFKEPVLVSSADGVGTKLKIAELVNKHDSVGIDCVAMNVNDILCSGAEPLFFLDYIAYSKVKQQVLVDVVKGINQGCIEAGCSLIGGETAQMPGFYKEGEYDIAGFCVGIVEKNNIIDGSKIQAGDVVIGLESNGLHSNGYSLVRKVLSINEQKRMSKELLKPTRIYVKEVLTLLKEYEIKGLANITGTGMLNLLRITKYGFQLDNMQEPQLIFKKIQELGKVSDEEMYRTFNMGLGFCFVASEQDAAAIKKKYGREYRLDIVGTVIERHLVKIVKGDKTILIEE